MLRDVDRATLASGAYDDAFKPAMRAGVCRQALMAPVWFFAVLGVWSVSAGRMPATDRGGWALATIVAGALSGVLVLTESQTETFRRRSLRAAERDGARGLACTGTIVVEMTGQRLVYQDAWTRSEFVWPVVASVAVLRGYVVITTLTRRMIVIPAAAVPAPVTPDELGGCVLRLREEAGGAEELVLSHLREGEHRCPSCGYELAGARSVTCPECGRRLTIEDLGG